MDADTVARRHPVDAMSPVTALEAVRRCGIVPVAVIDRIEDAVAVGRTLVDAGLPCIEVTLRTEAAPDVIRELTEEVPDLLVGAGTVMTIAQVDLARRAGARFIVSPVLDEDVVRRCRDTDLPVIPGVATATELARAIALGTDTVKFFPAEALGGTRAVRALASVMPEATFMPTGGIDEVTLGDYLSEPSVLACGGTWLLPRSLVAEQALDEIGRRVERAVDVVRSVRPDG